MSRTNSSPGNFESSIDRPMRLSEIYVAAEHALQKTISDPNLWKCMSSIEEFEDATKNMKTMRIPAAKQPIQKPAARNSTTSIQTGKPHELSDTAEKLANMTIGSGKQPARRTMPPPMKAGGWNGHSDLFLGRSKEIQPSRTYSRKVA